MKRPNFFIIGAPKCGTTSLAAWLATHPQIYFSKIKEPFFFSTDIGQFHRDTIKGYEKLFCGATSDHLAVGEASTSYFRSKIAVPAICKYAPNAKFIVCLRNPVDMAVSWHGQMCYVGWENERDFEKAWRLQDMRKKGKFVPWYCPEPSHLLYSEVCSLGTQLQRLFSLINHKQIFVIMLDDLRSNPGGVYRNLLSFLGVEDDGRNEFPVLNEARGVPRLVSIITNLVVNVKRKLGIYAGLGFLNRLNTKMATKGKADISPEFRRELNDYFSSEIQIMNNLLGVDVSAYRPKN